MTDIIRCPDCGHANAPGSASCGACNYPLAETAASQRPTAAPRPTATPREPAPVPPPRRPRRPRRRTMPTQHVGLWVGFAVILAGTLVFIGVKGARDQAPPRVEGSNVDQQQLADRYRHALEHDSTDVEARLGLADVLFDTGNWEEAILHYDRVVAADSARIGAIVDLGVCYYNTSRSTRAEELFQLALTRDPHHPVALFNLGIVNEQRGDYDAAHRYFHRCLEGDPPDHMRESLMAAMQRVQQASGRPAPPIQDAAR